MKIIKKYAEAEKLACHATRAGYDVWGTIPAKDFFEVEMSETEEAAMCNDFNERKETPAGWRRTGPILQVEEGSWKARYIQKWVKENLEVAYDEKRNVVAINGLEIELVDEKRNENIIGSLYVSVFLYEARGYGTKWYLVVEEKAYPGENWTMKKIAIIQLRNGGDVWMQKF